MRVRHCAIPGHCRAEVHGLEGNDGRYKRYEGPKPTPRFQLLTCIHRSRYMNEMMTTEKKRAIIVDDA